MGDCPTASADAGASVTVRMRFVQTRRQCIAPSRPLPWSYAGHDRTLTGTFPDSLCFRVHLAAHFRVDPADLEAQVIGEHGTFQVSLWSGAHIAGVPVNQLIEDRDKSFVYSTRELEQPVRRANINIIEGSASTTSAQWCTGRSNRGEAAIMKLVLDARETLAAESGREPV
jgi:malate/lactate dehydrogenase